MKKTILTLVAGTFMLGAVVSGCKSPSEKVGDAQNNVLKANDALDKANDDYIKDIRTKRAVERNIEIIGEAINRILKKDKAFEIENVQKIIGTRNRIAHGYDKISDDLIWSIVINHLPKLKIEIQLLLI